MNNWQQQFFDDPADIIVVFGTGAHRQHDMQEFLDLSQDRADWIVGRTLDLTRSIMQLRCLRKDRADRFTVSGYLVSQNPRAISTVRAMRVVITGTAAALGHPAHVADWHEFVRYKA